MDFDIGKRLKAIRTEKGLSQRELATRAGVTNGLISQLEQNRSSPSVASLKRILDVIPMTLSEFFSGVQAEPPGFVFRADELQEINPAHVFGLTGRKAEALSFRQVGDATRHNLQMLHETYLPGADTGEELYAHEAEEAGIVIDGEIELTVGPETATLGPGDAYIFDSRLPHRFRNTGARPCIIVSACTPPSF
ncbi:cupin domain-containing protein [Algicella marina]|uniref:cupin domain-containing protein n=1 Tax=Algicella marina TaxID=2683284 RepID=UPI00137A467C|nr:cupin domain-containing protein [Algicella marina]